MVVTAILAIRNEEAYLANCLRHLVQNQIDFVIIDNGSADSSRDIWRRREFAANLVDVQDLPFTGAFSLTEQLKRKMEVLGALHTDWVIHLDADEVMHSYREGETLNEALARLDAGGSNVVNCDEFVFLPIEHDYVPEAPGHQPIPHYYFFQPFAPRLMRAWKKARGFSLSEHGGHLLTGPGLRLAPEHLALRHYMVRSQEHAFVKYTTRVFAADDLARGWHQARLNQAADTFRFPPAAALRGLPDVGQRCLDRTDPWPMHYWKLAAPRPAPAHSPVDIKADLT
jgi:glycosyltransferase involved in cell wall biosynthesis